MDEARGLDPGDAHRGQAVNELGPNLCRQGLRLVLEPVPRAYASQIVAFTPEP